MVHPYMHAYSLHYISPSLYHIVFSPTIVPLPTYHYYYYPTYDLTTEPPICDSRPPGDLPKPRDVTIASESHPLEGLRISWKPPLFAPGHLRYDIIGYTVIRRYTYVPESGAAEVTAEEQVVLSRQNLSYFYPFRGGDLSPTITYTFVLTVNYTEQASSSTNEIARQYRPVCAVSQDDPLKIPCGGYLNDGPGNYREGESCWYVIDCPLATWINVQWTTFELEEDAGDYLRMYASGLQGTYVDWMGSLPPRATVGSKTSTSVIPSVYFNFKSDFSDNYPGFLGYIESYPSSPNAVVIDAVRAYDLSNVSIHWSAQGSNGLAITAYSLERSTTSTFTNDVMGTEIITTQTTSLVYYDDTLSDPSLNATDNLPVYYRITAINAMGASPGASITAELGRGPPVQPVTNLNTWLVQPRSVFVNWTAPSCSKLCSTGSYNIAVDPLMINGSIDTSSLSQQLTSAQPEIRITNLEPSTRYRVTIAPVNGMGAGSNTDVIFTTLLGPPAVSALYVYPRALDLSLQWRPPFRQRDVSGYLVTVATDQSFAVASQVYEHAIHSLDTLQHDITQTLPSRQDLYVRVLTHYHGVGYGKAKIEVVSLAGRCPVSFTFPPSQHHGQLLSNSPYNNDERCSWTVSHADMQSITLKVHSFVTEFEYDVLYAYPSAVVQTVHLFAWSGMLEDGDVPEDKVLVTPFVQFVMESDFFINDQGFDIEFQVYPHQAGASRRVRFRSINDTTTGYGYVVQWDAPLQDGGAPVTSYTLFCADSPDMNTNYHLAAAVNGSTRQAFIPASHLGSEDSLYCHVNALNGLGNGETVSVQMRPGSEAREPGPTMAHAVFINRTAVALNWDLPQDSTDKELYPVTRYRLYLSIYDVTTSSYHSPVEILDSFDMEGLRLTAEREGHARNYSYVYSALWANTTYSVVAVASNDVGEATLRPFGPLFTTLPPTHPGNVTCCEIHGISTEAVFLSWQPLLESGGLPIVRYRVYIQPCGNMSRDDNIVTSRDGGGGGYLLGLSSLVPADQVYITIRGLQPAQCYDIGVAAETTFGYVPPALQDATRVATKRVYRSPVLVQESCFKLQAVAMCAHFDNNKIACYGQNHNGQLGINSLIPSSVYLGDVLSAGDQPQFIETFSKPLLRLAGSQYYFFCAIFTDNTTQCWGNHYFALTPDDENSQFDPIYQPYVGDNTLGDQAGDMEFLPTISNPDGSEILDIAGHSGAACMVTYLGNVYCWGQPIAAELGQHPSLRIRQYTPIRIQFPRDSLHFATQVTYAANVVCVLFKQGGLKCLGQNRYGALGLGVDVEVFGILNSTPFIRFGHDKTPVVEVAVSPSEHVCARFANGRIRCWGRNIQGELGLDRDRAVVGQGVTDMDNLPYLQFQPSHRDHPALKVLVTRHASCALFDIATAVDPSRQTYSAPRTGVKCWGGTVNVPKIFGTNLPVFVPAQGQRSKDTWSIGLTPGSMAKLDYIQWGVNSSVADVAMTDANVCVLFTNGRMKCIGDSNSGVIGSGVGGAYIVMDATPEIATHANRIYVPVNESDFVQWPFDQQRLMCNDAFPVCDPENSVYDGDCAPCRPGTYYRDGVCLLCPLATYNPFSGQLQCQPCRQGHVTASTGTPTEKECTMCPVGTYADLGRCVPCPLGTFGPTPGLTQCLACGSQFVGVVGGQASFALACQPCPPLSSGVTDVNRAIEDCSVCMPHARVLSHDRSAGCQCEAGFSFQEGTCVPCPANSYKSAIGNTGCTRCPGTTQVVLSLQPGKNRTVCTCDHAANTVVGPGDVCVCQPGYTRDPSGACTLCQSGFKVTAGDNACTPCPEFSQLAPNVLPSSIDVCECGPFSLPNSDGSQCQCLPGYNRNYVTSRCHPCTEHEYQPERGNSPCLRCPSGARRNITVSPVGTSITQCSCAFPFVLNHGIVEGDNTNTTTNNNNNNNGSDSTSGASNSTNTTTATPTTTTTATTTTTRPGATSGAPVAINCICAPGYSYDITSQKCTPCPANTYKDAAGNGDCVPCPIGARVPAAQIPGTQLQQCLCPDTTSLQESTFTCECGPGHGFQEGTCLPCDELSYKDHIGNTPCRLCPSASISQLGKTCICDPGTFLLNGECVSCVVGGNCGNGTLHVAPGFWRAVESDTQMYQCRPEAACLPGGGCSEGHRDILCGKCMDGWSPGSATGRCVRCSEYNLSIILGYFLPMILALSVYLFFTSGRARNPVLLITVNYLQTLTQLQFPNRNTWEFLRLVELDVVGTLGDQCVLPGNSFGPSWFLRLLTPVYIITIMAGLRLIFWGVTKTRGRALPPFFQKLSFRRAALMACIWTFFLNTKSSLIVFACRQVAGVSLLRESPGVQCWTGIHVVYALVGGVFFLLFSLGIPIILWLLLVQPTWLPLPRGFRTFDISEFKVPYVPECHWWEMVHMVRRVCLIAAIQLLAEEPAIRLFSLVVLVFQALFLHVSNRPFALPLTNGLETLTLCTLTLSFLVEFLIVDVSPRVQTILEYTVVFGNVVVIALLGLVLVMGTVWNVRNRWKGQQAPVLASSDTGSVDHTKTISIGETAQCVQEDGVDPVVGEVDVGSGDKENRARDPTIPST